MNISKSQRSILAQFRCGILPIRIETGRYKGEPLDERICNFCVLNEIEDESHFLLNCTIYSDFRRELFNNIGYNPTLVMSNLDCIFFLLSNFPRQTSKYLIESYLYRQSLLYKNAMRNVYIYVIIVFAVTYRPNGPGVSLCILYNIL